MARFRLDPLGEAAILDSPEWLDLCAARPPEAMPAWVRYCSTAESGFGLSSSIASYRADDGALAVSVVDDDGPFTPGDPQGLRVGDPALEAAWMRFAQRTPRARGFESWLPRSIYHGFLRSAGDAGDRAAVALLDHVVEHVRSQGYSYFLVRYLEHDDEALGAALRERGARAIETRPGTRLSLAGGRDGWLGGLPSKHRREVGRKWRRFEEGGGRLVTVPVPGEWAARCFELHELTCARFSARPFLAETFFRMRPGAVDGEFHLFFLGDRLVGFVFCLHGRDVYAAKFGGADPTAPNLWGVMYQRCVEAAIVRGARTILTGPTGYEGKEYLGIDPIPMSNLFLALDPALADEMGDAPAP